MKNIDQILHSLRESIYSFHEQGYNEMDLVIYMPKVVNSLITKYYLLSNTFRNIEIREGYELKIIIAHREGIEKDIPFISIQVFQSIKSKVNG